MSKMPDAEFYSLGQDFRPLCGPMVLTRTASFIEKGEKTILLYGIVLSIMTCFCWGSTSICMVKLKNTGPYDMSLLRAIGGFAVAVLLYFIFSSGTHPYNISAFDIGIFIALVLFNNIIGDVFLFMSLHKLGVARASSIASTYPVIVAIFSCTVFGEKLTVPVVTGTLSVVTGVACLCQKNKTQGSLSSAGLVFAVLASFFWAIGLICNKILLIRGITPDLIVLGRGITFLILASFIWVVRLVFFEKKPEAQIKIFVPESIWAVLAGVLSLGFGAWFYSSALKYIPASVATPIGASNPLLATIFAAVFFKEKITHMQWLGIILAVGGSILVIL